MLFSSIIFIVLLTHPLFAVDLNIYKSVTEVRELQDGVGSFNYVFGNGQFENIVQGSISWDGTPFVKQEIYNTVDALKGATVTVRRSNACECTVINAKIIDPNTMLLQDLDSEAYFYADNRSIEYTSKKPNNGGKTLTIRFGDQETKYNGTLSYSTKGITWLPNYDLFFTDSDTCNLRCYANIANSQQQSYEIDNTYIYSGDIQSVSIYFPPVLMVLPSGQLIGNIPSSQSIQSNGEEKGFYSYSLKTNYVLLPSSFIRLPFINVNPKCQFYYQANTGIGAGVYFGVFQLAYDLTSDQFLPSGIITVRDNGVLIGQANLPDVPVNYTQTLIFGQDDDVRYTFYGNPTAKSPANANGTWQTYALNVTISNYKNQSVNGQLNIFGAIQGIISDNTCDSANINGNTINLRFDIKANDNYQCQFTVTST